MLSHRVGLVPLFNDLSELIQCVRVFEEELNWLSVGSNCRER